MVEGSVLFKVFYNLKAEGKRAYIRKKNGTFFSGEILLVDEGHVQIADRGFGPTVIAFSEIEEAREWKVGGRV